MLRERSSSSRYMVAQGSRMCLWCRRHGFDPWGRTIPWRRTWQPTPVFLPGKAHGERSLTGCSRVGHNLAIKQQNETIYNPHKVYSLKFYTYVHPHKP